MSGFRAGWSILTPDNTRTDNLAPTEEAYDSHHPTREDAFTLVEILVVILIIAVLAAIAVPAFLNQRKAASDATLESDLRNFSAAYETWRTSPENTNQKFRELAGGGRNYTIILGDKDGSWNQATTTPQWNNVNGTPKVTPSQGTFMTISVATPEAVRVDRWKVAHEEGDYCINGTNTLSSYNYTAGSSNASNYDKQLFFDKKQGGLKTIADLTAAYNENQDISCRYYVEGYKTATGK